jgi:hypothetical protein
MNTGSIGVGRDWGCGRDLGYGGSIPQDDMSPDGANGSSCWPPWPSYRPQSLHARLGWVARPGLAPDHDYVPDMGCAMPSCRYHRLGEDTSDASDKFTLCRLLKAS